MNGDLADYPEFRELFEDARECAPPGSTELDILSVAAEPTDRDISAAEAWEELDR